MDKTYIKEEPQHLKYEEADSNENSSMIAPIKEEILSFIEEKKNSSEESYSKKKNQTNFKKTKQLLSYNDEIILMTIKEVSVETSNKQNNKNSLNETLTKKKKHIATKRKQIHTKNATIIKVEMEEKSNKQNENSSNKTLTKKKKPNKRKLSLNNAIIETSNEQNDKNSSNETLIKKKRSIATNKKQYPCKMCDYKAKQIHLLRDHIAKHTGKKTFLCDDCGYSCERQYRMMEHLRTHTGEKPFSCEHCEYKCRKKELLTTHLKKHTGEKVYYCDTCGYKTFNKQRLREHIRIHTGEKPFQCHVCDFKSAYENSLNNHLKHHIIKGNNIKNEVTNKDSIEIEIDLNSTEEKAFNHDLCENNTTCICSFQLKSKNYLNNTHVKNDAAILERPFACDFCVHKSSKKYAEGENFMRMKPFSCVVCGFKCSNKLRLMAHFKIHDSEIRKI